MTFLTSLQVKIVNRTKERQIFEDIMLKLDRLENENLPQVKLGKTEVSNRNYFLQ